MIYIRGHRLDYDHWAYLGNPGWAYADVLPLFKRSEDFDGGESEYHGAGGELHVMGTYEPHPFHAAVVEAAQEVGIPFNPDHNGAEQEGVGYQQLMVKDGQRHSQAVAFLRPVLDEAEPDRPHAGVRAEAAVRRRPLHRRRDRPRRRDRAGARDARGGRLAPGRSSRRSC